MGKKLIVILTIAALGIFTLAAVGCAAVTDQRAAVSGIVVADGLLLLLSLPMDWHRRALRLSRVTFW